MSQVRAWDRNQDINKHILERSYGWCICKCLGMRKYIAFCCDQTACLITEVMNVGTWNPKYEILITTLPPEMSSPCTKYFMKISQHVILSVERWSRNFMEKKKQEDDIREVTCRTLDFKYCVFTTHNRFRRDLYTFYLNRNQPDPSWFWKIKMQYSMRR